MPTIHRLTFNQPYAPIDLPIGQGTTLNFCLLLLETVNPRVPLTFGAGWSARAYVRKSYDGLVILNNNTGNGRITLGLQGTPPDDYNVEVNVSASVTDTLSDWGMGVWDLEIEDPFGNVYTWIRGNAYLLRAASR